MVYRESPLEEEPWVDDDPNRSLVRLDVSGRAGRPGRPGVNGGSGSYSGAHGAHGTTAGAAERGEDAGTIEVFLETAADADHPTLVVSGRVGTSSGSHERVRNAVAFHEGGSSICKPWAPIPE